MIRPISRKTNPSFTFRCRLAKDGGTEAAREAPSGGARHHCQQAGRAGHPPRQPGASVSAPPFFAIPSGCFRRIRQTRRHEDQCALRSLSTRRVPRCFSSGFDLQYCRPRGYPFGLGVMAGGSSAMTGTLASWDRKDVFFSFTPTLTL